MEDTQRTELLELQQLGLSAAEAQVYVALLHNGSLGASAVAEQTGIPRSGVYPILCSLTDKGLVEAGTGYGSRFAAVPPDEALPSILVRERETLGDRERIAAEFVKRLASRESTAEAAPQELIQVLRKPQVVADRFERLQLEAEREILGMMQGPILIPRIGNPVQEKARRRGVRIRGLYERADLENPQIKPHFRTWAAAGEEIRIYDGELPHKLMIFDTEVVLLPLILPGDQTRTLIIRHGQLAKSLSMFFEFLWERAEPLALESKNRLSAGPARRKSPARDTSSSNHQSMTRAQVKNQ